MATIRYMVRDVDAALPFHRPPGFTLGTHRESLFALAERGALRLRLSDSGGSHRLADDGSGNPVELFEANKA